VPLLLTKGWQGNFKSCTMGAKCQAFSADSGKGTAPYAAPPQDARILAHLPSSHEAP